MGSWHWERAGNRGTHKSGEAHGPRGSGSRENVAPIERTRGLREQIRKPMTYNSFQMIGQPSGTPIPSTSTFEAATRSPVDRIREPRWPPPNQSPGFLPRHFS
jgi:hypothetical protein